MLKIIRSLSDLKFSQLMHVYTESNALNGASNFPNDTPEIQIHKAEVEFYHYLDSVFFRQKSSFYAVWTVGDTYTAALRIEPYSNGLLLSALETAPEARCKGYATALIRNVQELLNQQGSGMLYSHVSASNIPSLTTHKNCGFEVTKDYAVYSDGSVMHNCFTLVYKYKNTEI